MFRSLARARAPQAGLDEMGALLEAVGAPSALVGMDGTVHLANRAWREVMGAGPRLPGPAEKLFAAFAEARRGGVGEGGLWMDGAARSALVSAVSPRRFLVRVAAPQAPGAGTEAVSPPRPSAHGLDLFATLSPFGAALVEGPDPFTGPIIQVNDTLAAMTVHPAGGTGTLGELLDPAARAAASALHATGADGPYEVSLAGGDPRTLHLYLTPASEGWAAWLIDVTDQKAMQLQLAQRNKLEAVGQLAGGVAHDFNNLLSAIRLRTDELLLRHPLGDPAYEGLVVIRETVVRAADLVRQLLTFSRKATVQRESLDLGAALSDFEVMLRRLLREDVRLETRYGPNLPRVRADRAHLENGLINLVVNARDAVLANGGGRIRLRAARVGPAEAADLGHEGAAGGDMALIEVADDGAGIAPEVIGHIFEPFFTTKAVGEGTGLGLATVYGIVKQSDGWISVLSPPGEGAIFRIFLPEHIPPVSVEPPPGEAAPRFAARDLSGAGRILFVEDEPLVRGIAARLLRERGYEVLEAADGEEALDIARAHPGRIDLMISDVVMPGLDGPALLRAARPFLGDAPVMFISGYAEAEFSSVLEDEAGVSFLAKPLDITSLAERVKQALRGG